jgi:hypothetical protein
MIKVVNDILAIIGLLVVAQIVSTLLISFSTYLCRLFTKRFVIDSNHQSNKRQSCIYIPNYIKKLGGMIPQITDKTIIKPTIKIPNLEDCKYQPLVKDIPDIINSPISKSDESPAKQSPHAQTLPQEKQGVNQNGTLPFGL